MASDEERLVAFLSGDLDAEERADVDAHLLVCEACWRAVQEDRLGRAALATLSDPAPAGLADRVRLAVEVASTTRPGPTPPAPPLEGGRRDHGRKRRLVLAAASAMVAVGLGLGLGLGTTGRAPGDPPAVSALVSMASAARGSTKAMPAVEHVELAGRAVELRSYRLDGAVTLVAISARPFPMPPSSHVVDGSSPNAWMATRGAIGLYCLNAPAGRHSMLVAGAMPAVALPGVVARLHLVGA